jgi:hypothetical protein
MKRGRRGLKGVSLDASEAFLAHARAFAPFLQPQCQHRARLQQEHLSALTLIATSPDGR